MVLLSVNTDNIAIDDNGALVRGGQGWETTSVSWAHKGWNRQEIDLTGMAMQGNIFVPMAMGTQWLEPPAAWFDHRDLNGAPFPMIRVFDFWTTKPLTDDFIIDECLHLTDPYIFGIGDVNTLSTSSMTDDANFEQLVFGRARTFVPEEGLTVKALGFQRLIDDTWLGAGSPVGQNTLYYTRCYYTTLTNGQTDQFMDMPSQRATIQGEFVKAGEIETFQTIAQNKGVGGW